MPCATLRSTGDGTDVLERYDSFIASSGRWDGFALRADDIIISTSSKCGTTWMQTLVALLLFDGVPDEPIYDLSPWLDMNLRSRDEVHDLLGAQAHRRFIKTHTPLDGLPWDERVTYITVGRDPRDAFASMMHHAANMRTESVRERRVAAVGDDDLDDLPRLWPDSDDPRVLVAAFLDLERGGSSGDVSLAHLVHHLRLAWQARTRPNVALFHYADLLADLPAELARLARVLDVDMSRDRVEELARMATLKAMRHRADSSAPEASMGMWEDPSRFFRGGRNGDGARLMTDDELTLYESRVRELTVDQKLVSWLHSGFVGAG